MRSSAWPRAGCCSKAIGDRGGPVGWPRAGPGACNWRPLGQDIRRSELPPVRTRASTTASGQLRPGQLRSGYSSIPVSGWGSTRKLNIHTGVPDPSQGLNTIGCLAGLLRPGLPSGAAATASFTTSTASRSAARRRQSLWAGAGRVGAAGSRSMRAPDLPPRSRAGRGRAPGLARALSKPVRGRVDSCRCLWLAGFPLLSVRSQPPFLPSSLLSPPTRVGWVGVEPRTSGLARETEHRLAAPSKNPGYLHGGPRLPGLRPVTPPLRRDRLLAATQSFARGTLRRAVGFETYPLLHRPSAPPIRTLVHAGRAQWQELEGPYRVVSAYEPTAPSNSGAVGVGRQGSDDHGGISYGRCQPEDLVVRVGDNDKWPALRAGPSPLRAHRRG